MIFTRLKDRISTEKWAGIPLISTYNAIDINGNIVTPVAETPLNSLLKPAEFVYNLEDVRNRYAFRIQKGLASKLLEHKNAPALFAWLEIKPLFVSSVIFSDNKKFPYQKIATFLKCSEKQIRRYCAIWRKNKLAFFDNSKNLHLAKYSRLNEIFKHNCKRKFKLINNGKTKNLCRQIAIHENLKRQEYRRNIKIVEKITGTLFDATSTNKSFSPKEEQIARCDNRRSKNQQRKIKSAILRDIKTHVANEKSVYDVRTNQIEFGYPKLNPYVTLSCAGVAKACGLSAKSAGLSISRDLHNLGWITREIPVLKIDSRAAVFESEILGIRSDVFSYRYPVRRGNGRLERKYFRRMPQQVETLINTIIF